ncbi:MAG TPA: WecB/TagA/CpsF family glycosyltransferase, partial [Catenuloplanes sp.]
MIPSQRPPAGPVGPDPLPPVRVPGTARVLGVPVHAMTMDAVLDACERSVRDSAQLSIGVVNAAKLVNMRRDEWLRRAVLGADLILADGQSVVWASRLLHQPLPERVAGIDLFQA